MMGADSLPIAECLLRRPDLIAAGRVAAAVTWSLLYSAARVPPFDHAARPARALVRPLRAGGPRRVASLGGNTQIALGGGLFLRMVPRLAGGAFLHTH